MKYSKNIKRMMKQHSESWRHRKIMETRPLSATKRFRLLEVVEEAVII